MIPAWRWVETNEDTRRQCRRLRGMPLAGRVFSLHAISVHVFRGRDCGLPCRYLLTESGEIMHQVMTRKSPRQVKQRSQAPYLVEPVPGEL